MYLPSRFWSMCETRERLHLSGGHYDSWTTNTVPSLRLNRHWNYKPRHFHGCKKTFPSANAQKGPSPLYGILYLCALNESTKHTSLKAFRQSPGCPKPERWQAATGTGNDNNKKIRTRNSYTEIFLFSNDKQLWMSHASSLIWPNATAP